MKLRILFLLFWVVNVVNAQDNFLFRHLTVYDGLADNEVKCILKDDKGFLWCVTNSAVNRFDGHNVKQYLMTEEGLDLSTAVGQIQIDKENHIWIERYGHYFVYNREKDQFIDAQPILKKYGLHDNTYPMSLMIDDNKNVWSYNGHTIKCMSQDGQKFTIHNLPSDIISFYSKKDKLFYLDKKNHLYIADRWNKRIFTVMPLNEILGTEQHINYSFFIDSNLDIWIYSSNAEGLWLFTRTADTEWKLTTIGETSLLLKNKVISICEDHFHKIWIGLEYDGISIYDKKRQLHTHIAQTQSVYSLGSNKVWCFYCDDENTMWVGTMRNGLSYYNPNFFSFLQTRLPFSYDVACQVEDNEGNLWIGTDGGGIYKKSPTGVITTFKKENNKSFSNKITCFYIDSKGKIWVGTYLDGFGYYQNGAFHQYPFSNEFPKDPTNNSIWSITGDNQGNLWLGNLKCGLHFLNPKNGYFCTYNSQNSELADEHVMTVFFDGKKDLYLATCNGSYVVNTENHKISKLQGNLRGTQFITDSIQNNIYMDSRGLLWIGGREGLTIYDMQLDYIYYLNKEHDRLEGNLIRGITEDDYQNIWVVTTEGVTKIETIVDDDGCGYRFNCIPYNQDDGLQTSDFVHNSIYKSRTGDIMVGGNGGFYNVIPSNKYSKYASKVVFTELKVFGTTIAVDSIYNGNRILSKNIELTDKLTLNSSQNTFSLEFSTLEYIRTHSIRFSYRLKGINEQWMEIQENYLSFNSMAPGTYMLEVRATSVNDLWSEPSVMTIEITPPFWLSLTAKFIYLTLIILFVLYIWHREEQRHRRKMKYQEMEFEAKKQHEVDEMKLNFFTNLSHDFRTPLFLIIAPLEEVLKVSKDEEVIRNLHIVHKNALSLLNLVNQILDFRKIGMQKEQLREEKGNYIQFIEDIIKHFSLYTVTNHIALAFEKQIDSLMMLFDKEKMHKVFMNLLSNAIKYTGNPGKITVRVWTDNDKVFVSISDNGQGIEDCNKSKIFDAFYQIPGGKSVYGSGIGLYIVKELLVLHHGDIYVEDNKPQGSKFIFYIPIVAVSLFEDEGYVGQEDNLDETELLQKDSINKDKSSILIVEDNQDLRSFLTVALNKSYRVYSAVDGLHALSILRKEHFDMVITDVMMPNMDGIELCRTIKNDIKISHIPVIMLTAKSDVEDITKGLAEGADDYIQKPFNLDILQLKINKILKWKHESHKKFSISDIPISDITSSSLDESLIEKVIKIVENNIENSQLSVEELSNIMGMSRSSLYNKLISVTGKSPSEFIRMIRLKKSLQYLENTQITIAEVAYKVGFNSPKVFAHYFKEEYSLTPTEFRRKQEKDNAAII